jgi:PAS domain S-box-containing protein
MYRQAIAAADGVVYQLDLVHNRYTYVDPRIEELLGYTVDEIVPSLWSKIGMHVERRGVLAAMGPKEAIERYRSGEIPVWTADYQCRTKSGELKAISDSSVPLHDEHGAIIGSLGILQDITDRKRTEIALRESEERFRQFAQHIDNLFWVVDVAAQRIVYVSQAYETIYGRTCASLYSDPNSPTDAIHPEDLTAVLAARERNRRGENTDEQFRIVRPDGTIRWLRDRGFPVRRANGEVYRVVGIADDITEHKRLEEQVLQSQKIESIGRLAGGIAHDFNNILTAIMGFAELAADLALPGSELAQYIANISKSSERAAELTAQLLAFARKQVIVPQLFNLNDLILETDKILQRLIGEHIELKTICRPELRPIKADAGQMQQVLVNLAVNARDAMPDGGTLMIETSNVALNGDYGLNHPEVSPGNYVMLAISDTGIGMPESVQAHMFEPFFTTKAMGRGTGMGLATCYGIVKQNGGYIWVYSEPGHGTIFKIYLPAAGGSAEPASEPEMPSGHGAETILLVEDEPMVRDIAVRALKSHGYNILHAGNGNQALEVCDAFAGEVHLLISDVVLPSMSGIELAKRLKVLRPQMKVLYISGYTDNTITRHGVLDTSTEFLQKPFSSAAIAKKARQVLDNG